MKIICKKCAGTIAKLLLLSPRSMLLFMRLHLPDLTIFTLLLFATLFYFYLWYRMQRDWPFMVYTAILSGYWLAEAFWRIGRHQMYYYHFTVNTVVTSVSPAKAFLGAVPFLLIAAAVLLGYFFVQDEAEEKGDWL